MEHTYLAVLQSVPPSLWRGPCQQWELWDDGTEGGAEESGAACAKVSQTVKVELSSVWFTCMHC